MKVADIRAYGCWFQDESIPLSNPYCVAIKHSPFVDIPSGTVLCGPADCEPIRRQRLLHHKAPEPVEGGVDRFDDDVWAICDALMDNEGYEALMHYMPGGLAAAIKERIAKEKAGDPQARSDWKGRLDLARELAASPAKISAHMMAASALSIGYEANYFEQEPVWMSRPNRADEPREVREWETLRRDGALGWELPAGVMSRVMHRVQDVMRERGMLPNEDDELNPRLEWLERAR